MLSLIFALALHQDQPVRTPAIYRCPAAEAEGDRFPSVVNEDGYMYLCVDPKPGPNARKVAAGKVTFVVPAIIDTRPNRQWRDATIAFANGKISPKEWLNRTAGLKETVHFLTSPSTPKLRDACGQESGPAVLAELFMLSLPGKPCLTSDDLWLTRDLPEAGRLQSWILAMNDLAGPMLVYRHDNPLMITQKLNVVRADPQPGLFVFRVGEGKSKITFYLNNGPQPQELPPINFDFVTINRGLNVDEAKARLMPTGFLIEEAAK